jgi:phenylalanyl-tRNA synthetase beta chain
MKLSYLWLSKFFNSIPEPTRVSEILTNLGLEVEDLSSFTAIAGNLENLLIGETLSVIPHPNADRLKLCSVNIGGNVPLQIVCGALNVEIGQKVIVAPIGSTVYPLKGNPFLINRSRIRGEWSEGMLCADDEIGLGNSHDGIHILPQDYKVGDLLIKYLHPYKDWVLEIGITPNRSDALSHRGAARDILAFLRQNGKIDLPTKKSYLFDIPISPKKGAVKIKINQPDKCIRLSGVTIQGVKVKESPEWLRNSLLAIGIRPINSIVDVTNFICQDLGQPIHAYDADQIQGEIIIAQNSISGQKIKTLDGQDRTLSSEDLIISDKVQALAIAGIFGGSNSGISFGTQNIFLESACFNSVAIRKTARSLSLKTDASFRFERGTDPEVTLTALYAATKLILEFSGGELASDFTDLYPRPTLKPQLKLRKNRLNDLIGQDIPAEEVEEILKGLEINILSRTDELWEIEIPLFKTDVTREIDVIEEILRVYGFNKIDIPSQIRYSLSPSLRPDPEKIQEDFSSYLVARGFHEIQTNSLISSQLLDLVPLPIGEAPVLVLHPLSLETNMLRPNMISTSLNAIAYNLNRKSNDLKFYEWGKEYLLTAGVYRENTKLILVCTGKNEPENWTNSGENFLNFFEFKGIITAFFEKMDLEIKMKSAENDSYFSFGLTIFFGNHMIGSFGNLKNELLNSFGIEKEVFYAEFDWDLILKLYIPLQFMVKEVPKFPLVRRDLSLIISNQVSYETLKDLVIKARFPNIKEMLLFDVFQGKRIPEGKKSYSLRFILGNPNQTLTEVEIEKTMNKLLFLFQKEVDAEIPLQKNG